MPKSDKLVSAGAEIVGGANIIKDPDKLKPYKLDGKAPKIVLSPGTIEEVSRVVAYANQHRLGVIPRGNGTKIETGGIPGKADIVLLTGRLNRITDKDCDNLTLSVESGITLGEAQKTLAREGKGYFVPLDPPFTEKATLGGIVATNSSGPKRLLYGTARDLIIGMKTVFPNGDIVGSGGKTVKNVSGYDMGKILIGSFGTLGIICELTVRLLPLPEKEATLLAVFRDLSQAAAFVREIRHSQLLPASIEILNVTALQEMKHPPLVLADGNYIVAIGLEGVIESIDRQVAETGAMGMKQGALTTLTLDSEKHQAFWTGIRDYPEGLSQKRMSYVALKSSFLISMAGEMIGIHEKMARESGFDPALICHSGSGILYSYIAGKNLRSKIEPLAGLIGKLTDEAVKNEGNLVVESSPPPIKRKIGIWGYPRKSYEIMRRLKEEIDPAYILNPGRFVGGI